MAKKGPSKSKSVCLYKAISVSVITGLSVACAISAVFLFYNSDGFLKENFLTFSVIACAVFIIAAITGDIFALKDVAGVYRSFIIALILSLFALAALCFMTASGLKEHVSSVEELRSFINSFGANAVLVIIAFQILQVVILPVPGFVAVGATVALFGAFKGAIVSLIGILAGSFIAFYIGRSLGYKAASWVVGEKTLNKVLDKVEGKDKAVLTVMFVFPFFPDDVLCFVAGLSTMSEKYFSVMIILARVISVFTTAYSLDGNIIPYDTWWGILIWAALIAAVGALSYVIYKKGEVIERKIFGIFKKNRD